MVLNIANLKKLKAMKKLIFFAVLLLGLAACRKSGDKFEDIEVFPSTTVQYTVGESYHRVFTTSAPVYLCGIYYNEGYMNEEEQKDISSTYYKHPPFEVNWEGVRVRMQDLRTIEIWINADCRPTSEAHSYFRLGLSATRFWYDESTIWWVDNIIIYRNQPVEE